MWRFWSTLRRAENRILFGAGIRAIVERVLGRSKTAKLDQSIEEIIRFEKMLTNEGALMLKFWFHLSKQQQKKRLKALEKDPRRAGGSPRRIGRILKTMTVSESIRVLYPTDQLGGSALDCC